ncbi:replication initiation protein [Dyadobacter jiangsuensis]
MKKDKRISQVALPLEFHPNKVKEYAKQHWNITFARQKKVSVYAKRIIANVLAMIREDDLELRQYYQMHVTDVARTDQDISSVYKEVKKAFDELTDLKWLIEDIHRKKFSYRHLLNTSDVHCGYDNGIILVALNPILKPYFIEIAHYTTYELKHYMHFSSWYSMRMFELLSAFSDTGVWRVPILAFRELMDCESKYPNNTKALLDYILTKPLEELEPTKYAFTYAPVFDDNHKVRGRKPIIALEFQLKSIEPKNVPQEWFEFSDEHKKVLLRLRTWQVTDVNIVRYAKAIGMERANKLLYEWQLKGKEIEDKTKYCNAVWVRVGKAAMGEKP